MITFCKNCGAAFDETTEACLDCGTPNPYFDQNSKNAFQRSPGGTLIELFRNNLNLERTLLGFGALNVAFGVAGMLTLLTLPWSETPPVTRVLETICPVVGVGSLALAFRADLLEKRPMWRILVRVILILGTVLIVSLLAAKP
jgi:hypothetical protein